MDHYPEVVDGYFALPERPGLGVTLHEDFVGKHPRKQVFYESYSRKAGTSAKRKQVADTQAPRNVVARQVLFE